MIRAASSSIGNALRDSEKYHVVAVKSTVPPSTTKKLVMPIVLENGSITDRDIGFVMNPEFLREGRAIQDFMRPDRIVIGSSDTKAGDLIASVYHDLNAPVVRTGITEAEMVKYTSNAFLATKISFSNEIGNICKGLGISLSQFFAEGNEAVALDEEQKQMLDIWSTLNKEQKAALLELLKKMGYNTDVVSNGQEALQALKKAQYNLVIMDVQMPIMDGFAATAEIRSGKHDGIDKNTVVVALTAHAFSGYREKCIEAGMNDYITKPIMVADLSKMLEKWLNFTANESKPVAIDRNETFDYDELLIQFENNQTVVKRLVGFFLNEAPSEILAARQCLEKNDFVGLAECTHRLKGASANVRARKMNEISRKIQNALKDNNISVLEELVEQLEFELISFRKTCETALGDFNKQELKSLQST